MNYLGLLTKKEKARRDILFFDDDKDFYSTEQQGNAMLMGMKWNKLLEKITNDSSPRDMTYVLESRKFSLKYIVDKFGVYGVFCYFKAQWPHFFRMDYCQITCERTNGKGACREDQSEKCVKKLVAILKKLSFPRLDYFPSLLTGGSLYEKPEQKTEKRDFMITSVGHRRTAAVEKKIIPCEFHEEKEMAFKLPQSGVPICAFCRSRSVHLIVDNPSREIDEREIVEYLKKKAQKDKNKKP